LRKDLKTGDLKTDLSRIFAFFGAQCHSRERQVVQPWHDKLLVEPLAQQRDDVSRREKHLFAAKLAFELSGVSILDIYSLYLPLTFWTRLVQAID
jgi:hypothetical protein